MTGPDSLLIMSFVAIFAAALFLVVLTLGQRALLALAVCLPVIHLLGDIGKGTQPVEVFHTGNIGVAVHLGFVLLCLSRLRIDALTVTTLLFVLYLALLVPLSSYPLNSLGAYLKVAAAFMLLPICSALFTSLDRLRSVQRGMLAAFVLALAHFTVAQVFKIGRSPYIEGTVFLGGGGVFITYLIAYVVTGIPLTLALLSPRRRMMRLLIGLGAMYGLVIMIIVFRRGSLLGMAAALVTYFVLTSGVHRRRMVVSGVVAAGAAAITSPLYLPKLLPVLGFRGDFFRFFSETNRGRMGEFGVSVQMFFDGPVKHKLLGTDLFSSKELLGVNRALHVDYTNLLVTAGLTGLLLYLAVLATAVVTFLRSARRIRDRHSRRLLIATFMGLLAVFVGVSSSRQLGSVTSLTVAFLYLGTLIGVARSLARSGGAIEYARPTAPPVARRGAAWRARPIPRPPLPGIVPAPAGGPTGRSEPR